MIVKSQFSQKSLRSISPKIMQYIAILHILQYYEGVILHGKINVSQLKCPFREMGSLDPIWPKVVTPFIS